MAEWRLLLHGASEGPWNMAVDRTTLDAYEQGRVGPTLRLYRWAMPTVSLGRFQPIGDVSRPACESYGVALCRRPTGGRGVLHDEEITYSIVTGVRDGLPRGTAASYRALCAALVEAYRELGISAELTARPRGDGGAGACYLHATSADLSLGAAKLSGSAQVWGRDACLQHGSFVISRDAAREAAVFGLDESGRAALEEHTSTMVQVLGRRPEERQLRDAIVTGMARGLGADFVEGTLTEGESEQAEASVASFEVTW